MMDVIDKVCMYRYGRENKGGMTEKKSVKREIIDLYQNVMEGNHRRHNIEDMYCSYMAAILLYHTP